MNSFGFNNYEFEDEHNVLIIENDPVNTNFLKKKLNEVGFKCHVVESAEEAIEELINAKELNFNFEVIFLDINLNGEMTGVDFLKSRKNLELDYNSFVIVMTGSNDPHLLIKCYEYKINDYILKPISTTNIENQIEKIKIHVKSLQCPIIGYKYEKILGKGASGEVFLVKDKKTKLNYAMKKIKHDSSSSKEAAFMLGIKSSTILNLIDYKIIDGYIYMLLECAINGTLSDFVEQNSNTNYNLNADQILLWFTQILLGLYTVHEKSLIHRDIKSDNLFLCENDIMKIGDFGIARALKDNDFALTTCGTIFYMAPELFNNEKYNNKVDIWALGIVLYELIMLKKPFEGNDSIEIYEKIKALDFPAFPKSTDERLTKLFNKILVYDKNKRPSALELLQLHDIKEKINYILSTNLFEIDEEVIMKIFSELDYSQNNNNKINIKQNIFNNIEKSNLFYHYFTTVVIISLNSIKYTYQKHYFSTYYRNVIKGSTIMDIAANFNLTDDMINHLIKMKYIVNVVNNNEKRFIASDKVYYHVSLLEDTKIDNSLICPEDLKQTVSDPLKLTQLCLEYGINLIKKIDVEGESKEDIFKSYDFFEFMNRIIQLSNLKLKELHKRIRIAVILNIYQTMLIHYIIKGIYQEIEGYIDDKKSNFFFNKSNGSEIIYNIDGCNLNLYEMKNIIIRKNKTPLDSYFKLVYDNNHLVNLIEDYDEINKLLFICVDPNTFYEIEYKFTVFTEDVYNEINYFLNDFIINNTEIDEEEIRVPQFLKYYLIDFSNSESQLVKIIIENHKMSNEKKNQIEKSILRGSIKIVYN